MVLSLEDATSHMMQRDDSRREARWDILGRDAANVEKSAAATMANGIATAAVRNRRCDKLQPPLLADIATVTAPCLHEFI